MTTPVAGEGLALLRDLAVAAREEARRYWVRHAEEREALVLVGPRLWQMVRTTVAREGEPWWHLRRGVQPGGRVGRDDAHRPR